MKYFSKGTFSSCFAWKWLKLFISLSFLCIFFFAPFTAALVNSHFLLASFFKEKCVLCNFYVTMHFVTVVSFCKDFHELFLHKQRAKKKTTQKPEAGEGTTFIAAIACIRKGKVLRNLKFS